MNENSYLPLLEEMISNQLVDRGINHERILEAFRSNPRHLFVPGRSRKEAYADRPLPIGSGQTISQPYIVALMTDTLNPTSEDSVLEIGTGSGFQTAILASLSEEVYTVERKGALLEEAKEVHEKLGLDNIRYRKGDGTKGWERFSPFDRILGTGSVPEVPSPFIDQLDDGGRMVLPVGGRRQQRLTLLIKGDDEITKEESSYCSFLPLIGENGWDE
jgi:protein-L-isoaspartate(D-aspartate) O-methyltransferase